MNADVAFDTNILIDAVAGAQDETVADRVQRKKAIEMNRQATVAKRIVTRPAVLSAQVHNEFANVAREKSGFTHDEIHDLLETLDNSPGPWL